MAGIGSAIACLSSAQQSSVLTYRADRSFTGRRGRPPFNVSEDQLIFLVDNGFAVPKISELMGISKRTVERRMSMFGIRISGELLFLGFVTGSTKVDSVSLRFRFSVVLRKSLGGGLIIAGRAWEEVYPPPLPPQQRLTVSTNDH